MKNMPLEIGSVVSNDDLRSAFQVGNMGGMRKSNTLNCLVLISDHTKGLYEDKWYGDVLHYTGMGQTGDQVLRGNQNGTLFYSRTNGVDIHLFEVLEAKQYTYRGIVTLVADPYQEIQPDVDGMPRKVWMFPIKPLTGAPIISEDEFRASQEKKRKHAEGLTLAALEKAAKANSTLKPGTRAINSTTVVRDPYVSEYVKRLANGKCELCRQPAPFHDIHGKPYLETHHVIWLSKGGADSIDNAVALCPNCHRKMHVLNKKSDIEILLGIAQSNSL